MANSPHTLNLMTQVDNAAVHGQPKICSENHSEILAPIRPQTATAIPTEHSAAFGADCPFAFHIVNTIREPLMVLDGDLQVIVANRAFYRTFEVEKSDTEGRYLFDLGDGQWNIPALRELLDEILPRDAAFDDFEVRHSFPGIGAKIMRLNARRLDGEAGGPRILLAFEDITQRHQAEAALQSYIKKLEWSNRELQDFAYIASHDLQEPLRAIQAFGERLQTRCGDSLSPEGVDYLRRVQEAAGRMRVLIHDLLAFSRVTTKAQPFTRVDVAKLTGLALADLVKRLEESGGQVEIGELPCLEADPTQLRQLMQNLIDNALKFHRPDAKPRIRVYSISSNSENCHWVVEDDGIGFDQKYAERIFTPFQRLHPQRRYPGTGIGLAICRKIVERHHGTLTVESSVGKGTRFHIEMPLKQPIIAALSTKNEAAPSMAGGAP